MVKLLQSCIIAFSMYSKIPMPKTKWNKDNMKYAMCFFPLVGAVTGFALWGIGFWMLTYVGAGILFACCMTVIPILITGGIHMDGLLDTIDALSSYGDKEKRLEILKDPHAGAFAIIGACVYFVWSIGIWSEASIRVLPVIAGCYVISRGLSGYSVAAFIPAKSSGLALAFHDGAHKTAVKYTMAGFILTVSVWMAIEQPLLGISALLCAAAVFGWYYHICYHKFGGITGDLAGYFLQICELGMITVVIIVSKF